MTSHSLKFSFVPSVSLSSKSPFDQSPPASEVSIEDRFKTGLSRLLTFYKWPSEFFSSLEEWFKGLIPLLVDGLRKKLSTRPPSTHEWVIKNDIKCTYDNLRATLDIYQDCFEPCQCDLVRAILVGGDVSGLPGFYTTPLHIIARTESASHWRGPGGIWNREVHSVPEAVKIIAQLVKSKADPYQEDIYGKIPIDYATEGEITTALVHYQGKRKAHAGLLRPVSEPIPMPPPPPKAPVVETTPPPAPTVADLEAEIIKAVMEGRFDDVPDIQNKLDALKLKGALADEDDDDEPDFIGAGGQEIVPSDDDDDDDEPDFIGAGGQEIVSPIVPASTPTPPEWCVKGATVLYTSTGEECSIVAVHPPMPADTTTFVTISFDGSDSTRETSVDKLSPKVEIEPVASADPESEFETDGFTSQSDYEEDSEGHFYKYETVSGSDSDEEYTYAYDPTLTRFVRHTDGTGHPLCTYDGGPNRYCDICWGKEAGVNSLKSTPCTCESGTPCAEEICHTFKDSRVKKVYRKKRRDCDDADADTDSDDDYDGNCPFRTPDCDCYYSVCDECCYSCDRPVRGYLCGQCTFCKSLPSDY